MPLMNTHAAVSSEARCLNSGLSLHLNPYSVYENSKDSGKSTQCREFAVHWWTGQNDPRIFHFYTPNEEF